MNPRLPKLGAIPIKDRVSAVSIEYGQLDVIDSALVVVDVTGVRTQIPVGSTTCLLLGPGSRVSHAAVTLAARVGCLLLWTGEAGVRLYSAGLPGGARSDRLLYQARNAIDDTARLKVVRHMYKLRFGEKAPAKRSVEQLRGIEGARVRQMYKTLAQTFRIRWDGRSYERGNWDATNRVNQCLSAANACLYGVTESAVLAAGYSPAIGFIHTGKPLSFVYDIADVIKFETVVPEAFRVAASPVGHPGSHVRKACRDVFRRERILQRLVPLIGEVLEAGGLERQAAKGVVGPAFPEPKKDGDVGHRH